MTESYNTASSTLSLPIDEWQLKYYTEFSHRDVPDFKAAYEQAMKEVASGGLFRALELGYYVYCWRQVCHMPREDIPAYLNASLDHPNDRFISFLRRHVEVDPVLLEDYLHRAVQRGNEAIVTYLVTEGVQVHKEDLVIMCQNRWYHPLKYIIEYNPVLAKEIPRLTITKERYDDELVGSILMMRRKEMNRHIAVKAVHCGNLELFNYLVRNGYDDFLGLLSLAAIRGHKDIVKCLLKLPYDEGERKAAAVATQDAKIRRLLKR